MVKYRHKLSGVITPWAEPNEDRTLWAVIAPDGVMDIMLTEDFEKEYEKVKEKK